MEKSEKFDFINKKLKTLSQYDFLLLLEESSLKEKEKQLIIDIRAGSSINELSKKYNLSPSRISQLKREIYEKLYNWEKNYTNISQNTYKEKVDIEKLINEKISEALNERTKQLEQKEALLNKLLEKEEKKRIQKKLKNVDKKLNSRGTIKAEPITIIKNNTLKSDNSETTLTKKVLKKKYLPMYVKGEISSKEICNILEITRARLSQLKKDYLLNGENYFNEHEKRLRTPTNKTSDEIRNKICFLYKEKYEFKSLKDFTRDLERLYKIKVSIPTLKKILEEKGLCKHNSEKYIGISNEQIGTDFLSIMTLLDKTIIKKELSDLEQLGLIELCELAFSKTYLTLNSFSKKIESKNYRTSYSCIRHYIEDKIINIQEEWNYWNKNHEHFSYVYNEQYRLKVVSDIRNIYYPMFKKIEKFVIEAKEKVVCT